MTKKERKSIDTRAWATYDETAKGTLTKDHALVKLMKTLGWIWGGDWTIEGGRIDYQHFEKPAQ